MSNNGVTNPLYESKTAVYFGEQVSIVGSAENNCVIIQFEDGTKKVVNRFELFSTSLFTYNQERLEANNRRIEEYQAIAEEANAEKFSLWKQIRDKKAEIRNKCSEWGTKFLHAMNGEQKAEFKALRADERSLKQAAVAASNDAYSASLGAFMTACDNKYYV